MYRTDPDQTKPGPAKTILVVDDTPENIQSIGGLLQSHYRVFVATGGSSALKVAATAPHPDLILLDIMMPEMDGYEVFRRLRSQPATAAIPVIFVTALNDAANEVEGLALGAVDYIAKPVVPALLLARVRTQLELKDTRDRLKERNEDLERLSASTAGVGLWDYDYSGGRLVWCDDMLRLHGLSADGFGGSWEDWRACIHPEDLPRFDRECTQAFASDQAFSSEFRIIRLAGELRHVKITGVVRRDGYGKVQRVLGNCWDVTSYRQALIELAEAKRQAEAANAAKSQFLAMMSHELRTPLNAISGFAQLLAVTERDERRREQIGIINQSSAEMLRLIQSILEYSRIQAGHSKPDPKDFILGDEIRGIIRLFEAEAREKSLAISFEIASAVPGSLCGDAGILRQILMNLLSNALKFTERGSVSLRVQRAPKSGGTDTVTLLFEVTDTGVGIKPENQDRIFEVFEQEDNSSIRRFGGVGLGLAICKQLVAALQGEIWVESMPGVGSRFSFTAAFEPVGPVALEAAAQVTLSVAPGEVSPSILVVEDDPFSQRLLTTLLARLQCEVVAANDGWQAVEMLEGRKFDLILMDIQLPKIAGDEIIRRVRTSTIGGCDPAVPIIALTAYPLAGHREKLLALGMNDCLIKPLDLVQLTRLILQYVKPREIAV